MAAKQTIWLFNPYGPIPGEGWRPYRFTLLGEALAERGHEVIWWTANYSHHFKRYRSETWRDIRVSPGFTIRLVPTTSYVRNVSAGRLRFELSYAWRAYQRACGSERPALIVGTDPSQFVGFSSGRIARYHDAPLILDIFDEWPELFVMGFPKSWRWAAPVVLRPFHALRRHNLSRANGLVSLCETYMETAQRVAPSSRQVPCEVVFNGMDVHGFRKKMPPEEDRVRLAAGMLKAQGEIWAVFAGTLGENYDIGTILRAADLSRTLNPNVRFILAGEGPLVPMVKHYIERQQDPVVKYLGRLSHDELGQLYAISDMGLCAYGPYSNVAMPDKAYDYMAAGLPIVNSLRGELERVVRTRKIGVQYDAGSAESLVQAIGRLAESATERRMTSARAFALAEVYDCRVQYERYADFAEEVAGGEFEKNVGNGPSAIAQ